MKIPGVITLTVGLLAAALGTCALPATASAVPAATYYSYAFFPDVPFPLQPSPSTPYNVSSAYGTISEAGMPSPAVAVTILDPGVGQIQGNASLTYYFEFLGPPAVLPVTISGTLMANASSLAIPFAGVSSAASIVIYPDLLGGSMVVDEWVSCSSSNSISSGYCGTKPFTDIVSLFANIYYRVTLNVVSAGNLGSGSAMADPSIYIDPTFPNASEYTLAVSAGIGNPARSLAVPEPMSLALLGMGLAGVGCVTRRRLVPYPIVRG